MKISVSCFIRPSGQLNSAQTSNFQTFLVNLLRPYSIASLQETSLRFSFETIKSHLVPQRYSLHSYRIKCAEEYIDWESSLAKKAKISRKAGWSNPRPTAPQSIPSVLLLFACTVNSLYSGHRVRNRVFSHDVTAAMLESQNKETAAMLVSQTSSVGVELFSYANAFFCSNKFAQILAT